MTEIKPGNFSRRVKENYDGLSRYYDFLSGKAEAGIVKEAFNLILPEAAGNILDIGCGTGSALLEMQKTMRGHAAGIGVDISFQMCRKALRKTGTGIIYGSAFELPFKPDAFRGILMTFTLELFPEEFLPMILKECRRVLVSGGRMLVVSMARDDRAGWVYRAYCWAHQRFPHIIDCRPISAQHILRDNGYCVTEYRKKDLYGLPVEIILAEECG
jgi:demethylmenaquinone methyltransferase/2-methoxy-6-polyprenyl-1,4-benzoquinol methylase